jgi:hypothetical protein
MKVNKGKMEEAWGWTHVCLLLVLIMPGAILPTSLYYGA